MSSIKLTLNINKSVFVAFSIYNSSIPFNDIIIHTCDTIDLNLKLCNCQKLIRVTRVKYLGLIIDCNLRWKFHVEYLVMRLRSIIFKLVKLNKLLPTEILRTVYDALYKSLFQYGLLVWGGCTDNAIRPLEIQQNLALRICLSKNELYGSTTTNYKVFKVLPVRYLYKQFSIMFQIDKFSIQQNNKRENRSYDMQVNYSKKSIGQRFVDYLGPTNYNSLPFYLKKYIATNVNKSSYITNKKAIVNYLLLEL